MTAKGLGEYLRGLFYSVFTRLLGFAMIGVDGSDGPRRNSMGYLPLHTAD